MTLDRLAASWRRRWWIAAGLSVVTAALLGFVIDGVVAGLSLALAAVVIWWLRRPQVDARVIARHLNRQWPELEDSAELLLSDQTSLSAVEQLQRERSRQAFERVSPQTALPHRPWRVGLATSAAALAGAALLTVVVPPLRVTERGTEGEAKGQDERPMSIGEVRTSIDPPAYTGRPSRNGTQWDLEAESGSVIMRRIGVSPGTTSGALITSGGDTVNLEPSTGDARTARLEVERSTLYFVTIRDSSGRVVTSDFHQLTVIPDAPPTITVVTPEPRTTIAPGATSAVPLRVLVGDDYGIAETRLIATLTTGQGEGVKFREQELELGRAARRPDGRSGSLFERELDPRQLGLGPGDELYFYIIARDSRKPQANETRSETFFVTLLDTAGALTADFTGVAINLVPEYFRSQRQIIIDTERLLADRNKLTTAEFRARSENIGLDQHLLRLRYGEIVGDEIVEGDADAGARHEHDIEDNATRLAPQVKATLQASLAQMWQAELRLRTFDPQGALPFEYRALELLKEVQQSARVFVRRVGFEPPPLEPDRKRLTGDLSKIGRPLVSRDLAARDSLPAIREGLAIVRRHASGGTPTLKDAAAGDAAALERTGQELAQLAVAQPGRYLESLRRLRTLIDSLHAGSACAGCLPGLEADFLRALPPARPEVAGPAPATGVARRYFDMLRAP
jgi:hypothetical protein